MVICFTKLFEFNCLANLFVHFLVYIIYVYIFTLAIIYNTVFNNIH